MFIPIGLDESAPWNPREALKEYLRARAERRARERALCESPEFAGQEAGVVRARGEAQPRREQLAPFSGTKVIGYRVQLEGRFDYECGFRPLVDVTRVEDFVLTTDATSLEVRGAQAHLFEWPASLVTKPSAAAIWDTPLQALLEANRVPVADLVNARRLRYTEYHLCAGQPLTVCGSLCRRLVSNGAARGYRQAPCSSELSAAPQLGLLLRPGQAGHRIPVRPPAPRAVPEHALAPR